MRWTPGGRSDDLEDQRGQGGGGGPMLGGGGLRIGAGGAVLLLVLSLVTGQNLFSILGNVIDGGRQWYEIWVPQDPGAWELPMTVTMRDWSRRQHSSARVSRRTAHTSCSATPTSAYGPGIGAPLAGA